MTPSSLHLFPDSSSLPVYLNDILWKEKSSSVAVSSRTSVGPGFGPLKAILYYFISIFLTLSLLHCCIMPMAAIIETGFMAKIDNCLHNLCTIDTQLFSSAWLCQQSSWNQNLSIVRPFVSQLSLNLIHRFLSNFGCCFPWAIRSDAFWIFEKKKFHFLWIFFVFVNMAAQISKSYSSYKSQPKAFKLFWNFLPNGPYKTTFGIFEVLKIEILTHFFHMGPNGSETFKTLLLLQITTKSFQTSPEFSSQWSSQKNVWDFWNFENWNFNDFFFVFLNMGPYGSQDFKTLLLHQISFESFQTFSEFSS